MKNYQYSLFIAVLLLVVSGCGKGDTAPEVDTSTADNDQEISELATSLKTPSKKGSQDSPTGSPGLSTISTTGEFISPLRSELVARTPGRVETVYVEEGAMVARGQPLLSLETHYLQPELLRAEAELARTKALMVEAKSDFQRKTELLERESVPQAVFDRSQGLYEQARASVASADASVSMARQRLQDATLVAPFSGVVAERRVEIGERLSESTVAFVVAQLAPLRLRFHLPERYLPLIKEGQEARARVAPFPGEVFTAKVVVTGKVADPETRTFSIEAEIPNLDHRLRPGLFARVEFDGFVLASSSEN